MFPKEFVIPSTGTDCGQPTTDCAVRRGVSKRRWRHTASSRDFSKENIKHKGSKKYRFKGARIKAAQDIIQRHLIHRTTAEKRRIIPCYAGRLNVVVTENGDVYPCEILSDSLNRITLNGCKLRKREHDD